MDKLKVLKKKQIKRILITIKISVSLSNWLKEKSYSPTYIFNEACNELGYKEEMP